MGTRLPAIYQKSLQFSGQRTSLFRPRLNGRQTILIFLVESSAYTYAATNSSGLQRGRWHFSPTFLTVDCPLLLAFIIASVASPTFLRVLNVRDALSMSCTIGLCTDRERLEEGGFATVLKPPRRL